MFKVLLKLLISVVLGFSPGAFAQAGAVPSADTFNRSGTATENVSPADVGNLYPLVYDGISLMVQLKSFVIHQGQSVPYFEVVQNNGPVSGKASSGAGQAAPSTGGSGQSNAGSGGKGGGSASSGNGSGFKDGVAIGMVGINAVMSVGSALNAASQLHHALANGFRSSLEANEAVTNGVLKDVQRVELLSERLRVRGSARAAAVSRYMENRTGAPLPKIQEDGSLNVADLAKSAPESPLTHMNFSTPAEIADGKLVRQLADQYQLEWAYQNAYDLASDNEKILAHTGMATVIGADAAFSAGRQAEGLSLATSASEILEALRGFKDGVYEGGKDIVVGLPKTMVDLVVLKYNLTHNPREVITAAQKILNSIPEIYQGIQEEILKQWDVVKGGSSYDRGVLAGKVSSQVVAAYLAGAASKAAAQARRAAAITEALGTSEYSAFLRGKAFESVMDAPKFAGKVGRLETATRALESRGLMMSQNTRDFVASQVAFEERILKGHQFSHEVLEQMGEQRHTLESLLPNVKPVSVNKNMYRGIPRQVKLQNGVVIENTPQDIFKFTRHSYDASHRYCMPSQTCLFGVLGENENVVRQAIIAENKGVAVANILIDKQAVHMSGVLDLTDPNVVRSLRLNEKLLSSEFYYHSQTVSDAAKAAGFRGILFPSAQIPGTMNLVIF